MLTTNDEVDDGVLVRGKLSNWGTKKIKIIIGTARERGFSMSPCLWLRMPGERGRELTNLGGMRRMSGFCGVSMRIHGGATGRM